MPEIKIFLDSSVLVAGVISSTGAARVLMLLADVGKINILVSEQVIVETERALARKAPLGLLDFRKALKSVNMQVVRTPTFDEYSEHLYMMSDPMDVPILVAAMKAKVDFLVTLDRKHFLDDPKVAEKSGLRIGTPGDALAWVREQMRK
jgi:predicted nucleic acid-binding protein